MGSNRRYTDANQRRRSNREADARALVSRSPTDAERGGDPTRQREPVPVSAWIDDGNASAHVLGSAVAWTRRCVRVIRPDSHDQAHEAWLWAGAVERVDG